MKCSECGKEEPFLDVIWIGKWLCRDCYRSSFIKKVNIFQRRFKEIVTVLRGDLIEKIS